jgi:cation diffusion facilitator family transporter
MRATSNRCRRCLRTTVWICFFECLFIAVFKTVIGLTSGSKAMLGSALYSLTDLVSAFLLLVGLKVSARPADSSHPYGHGKVEHVVSLLIGLIVLAGAVGLALFSALSLYHIDMTALPHWIGIWASLACICLSEIVYRLVICAGTHAHSPALTAQVKHMQIDMISSYAVIIAILAAEAGFRRADAIIAMLESVHVLFECSKMLSKSVSSLMDASVGRDRLDAVRAVVSENPNVIGVSGVKGTHSGRGINYDVELRLDGRRTIEECNETVRALEDALTREIADMEIVRIHYHPEVGDATFGGRSQGAVS